MSLTRNQVLSIIVAVLSACAAASAQLTDIFGPGVAKMIISVAGLLNTVLSSILAIITSQGGQIRDVQSMAGVEKITVNKDANSTLATLAVDPAQDKIEASPSAQAAVEKTAKGD